MDLSIFVIPTLLVADLFISAPLNQQDDAKAVVSDAAAQKLPQSPTTSSDAKITPELEKQIKTRLYAEMQASREFAGAWVEVVVPQERDRFSIVPILDAGQIVEQRQALEKLLKELLPNVKYDLQSAKTRPISKYLADIQVMLDIDLALGGCLITGAHYEIPIAGNQQVLILHGRIADEQQKSLITDLCREVQKQPRYLVTLDGSLPKTDNMKLVAPSRPIAARAFNHGILHYIRRDYDAAHRSFTKSILEAPDRLQNRYWQVVTEIAQGNEEHAYKHVRRLVAMRKQKHYRNFLGYEDVLESLERVQGPVRRTLQKLERRAFLEE